MERGAWHAERSWPETVALRAAGFVVGHGATRDRFIAEVGLPLSELSRCPILPQHLAAVLDFMIAHEPVLLAFVRSVDLPLEAAYEARRLVGRTRPPAGGREHVQGRVAGRE